MLFTGDIEGVALRTLLRMGLPHCDVLIAPHHGSRTGLPQEIVSKVHPGVIVVSGSGGRDWPGVSREFYKGWNGVEAVLRTAGGSPEDRGAISITVLNNKNIAKTEIRFQNVYPVSLGSLSYDIKANDVSYLQVNASFNYMYYDIVQISSS